MRFLLQVTRAKPADMFAQDLYTVWLKEAEIAGAGLQTGAVQALYIV